MKRSTTITRACILLAMLPLLLPSGLIVTVCLETGLLGLRGISEVICGCDVPATDCCCCDLVEEAAGDPCCVDVATVGEDPVDSTRVVTLSLPQIETVRICVPAAFTVHRAAAAPVLADVALTRRRQPLLI